MAASKLLPKLSRLAARFGIALLASLAIFTADAAAPQAKTQVPGYYRLMVGKFEVTALYDGYIDLDTKLLKNTT